MKVSRAQFVLSHEDVSRLIAELVPGETAGLLEPQFGPGTLLLRLGRRPRLIDVRPAIELRVASLTPTRLTLTTRIRGLPLVDRLIRDQALPRVLAEIAQAGLSYGDGRIELDLDQLLPMLPVSFTFEKVIIMRGGIIVAVRNLAYAPQPEAEAGPAAGAPTAPAAEAAAALPVPRVPPALPVPAEATSLYDRVRSGVKRGLDRALPGPLRSLTPWVLALPDLTVLLWRLARHAGVDARRKAVAAGALAYVIWPLDFMPDLIPALGWLDDTTITLLALTSILSAAPAELRAELWPGESNVLTPLEAALNLFERVVGRRLLDALKRKVGL
ncbi:MAG: YkvA family protein [Chloroflexota bacterium]